jgi:hypothetical protein
MLDLTVTQEKAAEKRAEESHVPFLLALQGINGPYFLCCALVN